MINLFHVIMAQIPVLAKLLPPTKIEQGKKGQQYQEKRKIWHTKKQSRGVMNNKELYASSKLVEKQVKKRLQIICTFALRWLVNENAWAWEYKNLYCNFFLE